ncbi:heavy metal translocating P-type ATPase [Lentibacillus saliphilus]|uniref:heavy metal translocating P-type ATPase n=1 Tax=Lentibacillus saliphilus TaxID=2737028 RepID=UPI001C30CF74|nr:cation-translocating P-type ATPase [Lentibacillus saliphilus]
MSNMKRRRIVVISGVLLIIALILHALNAPFWKNTILMTATIVAGYSIAIHAVQSLRMKVFSIELLVTIAVVGAFMIGEYVESAAVTFLFVFGAYLEARTLEKTRSSLKTLMDMAPEEATVLEKGQRKTVPVEKLAEGDVIVAQSGGKLAIDGTIISGQGSINESAITGESLPVNKSVGDHVYSGTFLDTGYVEVKADKVGDDTTFAKLIELVEEAQETKAKTQKFLERFARLYTPGILVLSIIVFLITRNIDMTLTFLVIACPGALVISAPVSLVAGIGNGAKQGALLKGGEVMENLAKIDVFVFDKTGTLTKGQPEVTSIKTFGMEIEDVLKLAAEAEIMSEHHLGRAIVQEAEKRRIKLTHAPVDFAVEKGKGLHAAINDQHVVIGNRQLMAQHHITVDERVEKYAQEEEQKGSTAIFVSVHHHIAGVISIADQIRDEAFETIEQLKAAGIKKTVMLTGDHTHTAEQVARQVGVDCVMANMLPEDKVAHIKQLRATGHRVAMVGDGINDAPAIAFSDVGIAMGAVGTDVAMETADVVLMADQLKKIPYAYRLAQATVRNMKQNMFLSVGTVGLLLVGVLLGHVFLASGMLIHELSVLIVILNAIRLVRYQPKITPFSKQLNDNEPLYAA